ncbi:hypothetical protein VNO77_27741 [Canavalia gladiata]|uniref:Uncharacterized protein n=1 Tax=Canavalia gladiata TaxID=3824 RepID=A0AAN9Q7C1_CANGL
MDASVGFLSRFDKRAAPTNGEEEPPKQYMDFRDVTFGTFESVVPRPSFRPSDATTPQETIRRLLNPQPRAIRFFKFDRKAILDSTKDRAELQMLMQAESRPCEVTPTNEYSHEYELNPERARSRHRTDHTTFHSGAISDWQKGWKNVAGKLLYESQARIKPRHRPRLDSPWPPRRMRNRVPSSDHYEQRCNMSEVGDSGIKEKRVPKTLQWTAPAYTS